jgi:hypothetical protein
VRTWIIAVGLCIIFFILPLQCFIIGDDRGIGIQGSVYRWQMTIQGDSLIPITQEVNYIQRGLYTGKTALSVILWTLGTVLLALTTMISLIYWSRLPRQYLRSILMGLTGAGIIYLGSLCAQYGPLFSGPAGISLPIGVIILFLFAGFVFFYREWFFSPEEPTPDEA